MRKSVGAGKVPKGEVNVEIIAAVALPGYTWPSSREKKKKKKKMMKKKKKKMKKKKKKKKKEKRMIDKQGKK